MTPAWLAGDAPAPARILIVVAHPDDETLAAASVLGRWPDRVTLVHVTDGAPRDLADAHAHGFATAAAYAAARRAELIAALAQAGIGSEQARVLEIADQAAVRHLPEIARALAEIIAELRPGAVLTHAYEGGHPDHDSTAFAVHAAFALTGSSLSCRGTTRAHGRCSVGLDRRVAPGDDIERAAVAPSLIEFPLYRAGPDGMAVQSFLPLVEPETRIVLDEAGRRLKREMIACFRTQASVLARFPVVVERFRAAPACDFTLPPHSGRLWYEHFDWGTDGAAWRRAVGTALSSLGLPGCR